MSDYRLTITESILEHARPSNEVFSISSEDSEFEELQEGEKIVNDDVVVDLSVINRYLADIGISEWLGKGTSHDTSNDMGHAAAVESSSRHLNQTAAAHQPEEDRLGNARLGYGLKLVRHGIYEDRPSSLIVLDFDFNYDSTCAITRAQISIIFGSKITQESAEPPNVSIVPFATDMRWPRKASGPLADTEISDQTTWKLNLGAQGYNIESPEFMRSISGKKTDSGWRIAGGPVFVNKPFPCRRGFLWTVNGHEFNRFPVPENFSLGMIVNHDMVDYWVQVNIEGSLRGVIKNHAAKLWA
ncbi:hypothetical protein ASPCAL12735 [Aspergillus calidoustus]|uniref:Uncharacterized protein n=1 Tax=Aspergillus calidoustus TaxID=454130 RepID=A0A0U5GD57_ASPCI|nr:hypothetical protein ASPCAL12735 [Aspergillus calidoustus]